MGLPIRNDELPDHRTQIADNDIFDTPQKPVAPKEFVLLPSDR